MFIRRADPADAAAVGALTRDVYVGEGYADPQTAPAYVASLSDGARRILEAVVFVAESSGEVLGCVTACPVGSPLSNIARLDELEVRMLAVRPDARRQGAAAALMSACETLAVDDGNEAVVLSTCPTMKAAQRLYERRGYARTPERDWTADGTRLHTYRLNLMDPPAHGTGPAK